MKAKSNTQFILCETNRSKPKYLIKLLATAERNIHHYVQLNTAVKTLAIYILW
jgi:hypothetical protein